MPSTIITKNSSTASAVPGSGSLTQGELAVNVTDKKLYTKDSGGSVVTLTDSMARQASSNVTITGGSITGITDLAVADGGTGASTAATARTNLGLDGFVNMKNRIINGAMVIDQRNAGASVTVTDSAPYTLDRWWGYSSPTSKFTIQQNAGSVTPPAGFKNYLGATSSSAYTVTSADQFIIPQIIEGYNVADLEWGTANAKTVTLSFWVRSSLTGTFAGSIQNGSSLRSYVFSYSIPVANTWTQISVTIAGDTTGTWNSTNGSGLIVIFTIGAGTNYHATAGAWSAGNFKSVSGATSVVGTNGATFYITGVQLEVGSTATSFDYRPYGTEFSLCERYFQKYSGGGNGGFVSMAIFGATEAFTGLTFPQMRTGPSLSYSSLNDFQLLSDGVTRSPLTTFQANGSSNNRMEIQANWSSNLTAGFSAWLRITNSNGFYSFSAEL